LPQHVDTEKRATQIPCPGHSPPNSTASADRSLTHEVMYTVGVEMYISATTVRGHRRLLEPLTGSMPLVYLITPVALAPWAMLPIVHRLDTCPQATRSAWSSRAAREWPAS
jgi:hypothetical protein